ncbi:9347_t:CDS:1, partial [Gigaspora rosea]
SDCISYHSITTRGFKYIISLAELELAICWDRRSYFEQRLLCL